jgi:hypothetical protein
MLNSQLLAEFSLRGFASSTSCSVLFYLEQILHIDVAVSTPGVRSTIIFSDYPPSSWRTPEHWSQFLWTNFPHKDRRKAVGAGNTMVSSIYPAIAVALCVEKLSLVIILASSAINSAPILAIRDLVSQFPVESLVLRSKI